MKKWSILILGLLFLTSLLTGCGSSGDNNGTPPSTAVLENVGSGGSGVGFGDTPFVNGKETLRYQTFIANGYANLTGIELKLRRFDNSGDPNDAKVQLFRTDSNHQPTGTSLATTFISSGSITNINPQAFQQVSVNLQYSGLINGNEYAIVLSQIFPKSDPGSALPHYEVCAAIKNQPQWHFGQYDKTAAGYEWKDESNSIGPAWIRILVSNANSTPVTGSLYMSGISKFGIILSNDRKVAQVFTASAYSKMTSVKFEIEKVGAPTDLIVRLYAVDASDNPVNPVLAETTVSAASIGAAPVVTQITAPLSYSGLVDGTRYAIVLSDPSSPTAGDYYLPGFITDLPLNNSLGLLERGFGWENTDYSYNMVINVAK